MQERSPETGIDLTITVRFGDTDPYGVVYFASYFRYCHQGIEEFLSHYGLPPHEVMKNQTEGFGLPIVSSGLRFSQTGQVWREIAPEGVAFQDRGKIA